jgi:hypothetical protein
MKRISDLYRVILEGGNVKVGPKGQETSAAPFSVTAKNRGERRADIQQALGSIHDTFHNEHGEHLFGPGQAHIRSGHAYTGSTNDLMGHHVSHEEFAKHKPSVGDVDVQVSHEHKDKLGATLAPGKRFGKYTVVGTKKHGNEISAVMRHDTGEHHQFDFQGVHHPGSEAERFLHSSNWQDTKAGIKGAHHKILLNAVAGNTHKFSITHGLRSRTDDSDPGVSHPTEVAHAMFGRNADHHDIHSFHGVTQLINKHKSPEEKQAIYNKFKDSVSKMKGMNHEPALEHLRKHLGVHDTGVSEDSFITSIENYINEDLRTWFNQKWVRMDTKGKIKGDCAREEGEGKPKCLPMAKAQAMDKEDRATAARRKRREDPVADREGKGGKPINVRTEAANPAQQAAIAIAMKKAGKKPQNEEVQPLEEKNAPTNPALWSRAKSLARQKFDVYPSAYANGWAAKYYKSKGGGWKTVSEEAIHINEEAEQHAHMSYLGASPHTHVGHHTDVGGSMDAAPAGKKFIGLSGKSDAFSDKEREDIANRQSGGNIEFKTEKSPGFAIARAYKSMKGSGKKILHLHFGHDRKDFAEKLKGSIEAGKIPELEGNKPDEVRLHFPKDEGRSHGMSGTKMRTAAAEGDLPTYKKHLGPNFSDKEAKGIMDRTRVGLMAGKIKVKR